MLPFIYAIIIGAIFAFIRMPANFSIVSILVLMSFRAIKNIPFKKDFITGVQSPYQFYLSNLEQLNRNKNKAALKYFANSFLIDSSIAVVIFLSNQAIHLATINLKKLAQHTSSLKGLGGCL